MKIGLALSGGGIRGIAHAGVIQALEEKNIKIDIIGGTSSGSMVAVLYAMGYSPYHIYILFKRYAKQIAKLNSFPLLSGVGSIISASKTQFTGIRSGNSIEEVFDELANRREINTIKKIKMPIVIPTVDITEGKEYICTNDIANLAKKNYITDIKIGKAVRASCSFPIAFGPCSVENHLFMDGGILDNIPVSEVKAQGADKVIAVKFNADEVDEQSDVMDIIMKTTDIMGSKISEKSLRRSDIVLNVYTDKIGLLDIEKMEKCYKYGYDCVMENKEIEKLLK